MEGCSLQKIMLERSRSQITFEQTQPQRGHHIPCETGDQTSPGVIHAKRVKGIGEWTNTYGKLKPFWML